jgi:fructose-1,6-bisphosphatase II
MVQPIDRNLGLELVRATEAAAMTAARWMGRGDQNAVDQAAVTAIRTGLAAVDMDGVVVIGEGERDEAPMLYIGEQVGNGNTPQVEVAVDPIDGTALVANGLGGAISVVALAEREALFFTRVTYMEKIIVGSRARGVIDISAPVAQNVHAVAKALGRDARDLTIALLNRPRNEHLIEGIRETGARIRLFQDGDAGAGLMALMEDYSGIDMLVGIGGAPQGVIAACAARCLGGDMQARLWANNDTDLLLAATEGVDLEQTLTLDDLCQGEQVFVAATGVTDGELLRGVRYVSGGATTESLVMRAASGTVRRVAAQHNFTRLRKLAGPQY